MKFIFLIISISIFWVNICLTQTRITTKSGHTFIGFILSENDIEIELINLNDENVVIPRSAVDTKELLKLSVSTKSGIELSGTLTIISDYDFNILTDDSIKTTIRFDDVEKFKIEEPEVKRVIDRKLVSSTNKSVVNSDLKQENNYQPYRVSHPDFITRYKPVYKKFGVNYGTPAGINIMYGYTSSKLGFHISAGYWKYDLYGFQIGPTLNLGMNEDSELNLVVAYGVLQVTSYYYQSVNILLDAYLYGLHFEVGLGFGDGNGNVSSPQILFQIGIALRWD